MHTPLATSVKVNTAKNKAVMIRINFFIININSLINIIYTIEESVNSIMYVLKTFAGQLKSVNPSKDEG